MDGSGIAPVTLVLGKMPPGAGPGEFLAAGPWCFCGQEKDFPGWENSFTFAPEPLADRSCLPSAVRAAQALCARLIAPVAEMLCPEAAQFPPVYWQILLAPWLIDFASQIVERSLRCQAMVTAWGKKTLIVPVLPPECKFDFTDEHDFTLRGSLGQEYNFWLFSRLLEPVWPQTWQKQILPPANLPRQSAGLCERLRAAARDLIPETSFPRLKGASFADSLKLSRALAHECHTPDTSLDIVKAFDYASDLEKISLPDLAPLLAASVPLSLKKLAHKLPLQASPGPRLKIAPLASHENASIRQQLAVWRASGNRLAHIQHGGIYGEAATPCAAEVVEYSQDIFFTWGWQSQGKARGNFMPLPSLQLSGLGSWQGGEKLIFVGTEMAAYGRRLDSHPTPMQFVACREAKAAFFGELGADLQAQCLYRPYFSLPGTLDDADWLLERLPALQLCKGALLPQILACRLLVVDHPGTTMLEAFAADIPIILYWRREDWPFAPEAALLLDLLEEAGIWFPEPQAAARKVRAVWQETASWWNSAEIRLARRLFCKHQALTAQDAVAEWVEALEKL